MQDANDFQRSRRRDIENVVRLPPPPLYSFRRKPSRLAEPWIDRQSRKLVRQLINVDLCLNNGKPLYCEKSNFLEIEAGTLSKLDDSHFLYFRRILFLNASASKGRAGPLAMPSSSAAWIGSACFFSPLQQPKAIAYDLAGGFIFAARDLLSNEVLEAFAQRDRRVFGHGDVPINARQYQFLVPAATNALLTE